METTNNKSKSGDFFLVTENNLLSVKHQPLSPRPVNSDKESYIFPFNFPFTLCDFMRRYTVMPERSERVVPGPANIAHTR